MGQERNQGRRRQELVLYLATRIWVRRPYFKHTRLCEADPAIGHQNFDTQMTISNFSSKLKMEP